MRSILTAFCLLVCAGCAHGPVVRNGVSPDQALQCYVGQPVTLRGRFDLAGKVGPCIHWSGEPVYLVPHGSFAWSADYKRMQGKILSITGVLCFRHFDRVVVGEMVEQPFDYYYFDAETAKFTVD